ncbi:hypothetical protein Acj133p056 [Acinetobacter phage 133]|uniref:Uncharacterized protein n=1 Tax=Acinetobacter phage 133 TaxID=2919552 RepID=D9I622_9CAUD|nr:hypothetical protein Acj133p056 [Acinetobacter phage 133]ADJ19403.1 hypothetical protein Acj133p056 [Acinetobacter phage 133]
MNISETDLGQDIQDSLYRITKILENRSLIMDLVLRSGSKWPNASITLGTYDDITNANSHQFTFDTGYLSCKNCELFAIDKYSVKDYVEPSTITTLETLPDVGMVTDVLEFLASKFIYVYKTYGTVTYPINDEGYFYRSQSWLNPQRWLYLKFLKTELEYFLMNGRFNNDLSRP